MMNWLVFMVCSWLSFIWLWLKVDKWLFPEDGWCLTENENVGMWPFLSHSNMLGDFKHLEGVLGWNLTRRNQCCRDRIGLDNSNHGNSDAEWWYKWNWPCHDNSRWQWLNPISMVDDQWWRTIPYARLVLTCIEAMPREIGESSYSLASPQWLIERPLFLLAMLESSKPGIHADNANELISLKHLSSRLSLSASKHLDPQNKEVHDHSQFVLRKERDLGLYSDKLGRSEHSFNKFWRMYVVWLIICLHTFAQR